MSSPTRSKRVKKTINTYDPKLVEYLASGGAKTEMLYERDGFTCTAVKLQGRKQIRMYDAYPLDGKVILEVAENRVKPPIYTLKVNGEYALLQDLGSDETYFAVSRDPELLGKTSMPATVHEIADWEELKQLVAEANLMLHNNLKVFVGYGPGSDRPFRESHALHVLERIISDKLQRREDVGG